jgi:hypothetical protein
MGVYRTQTLTIANATNADVRAILQALREDARAKYVFDLPEVDPEPEHLSRYGCRNDRNPPDLDPFLGALSQRFPHVLFTVDWHYDAPEDAGRTYYQNGRTQEVIVQLSYPSFDPAQATPVSTDPTE